MKIEKIEKVGKAKIGKDTIKGHVYPKIRFSKAFSDLIGKKMNIYRITIEGKAGIMITESEIGHKSIEVSQEISHNSEIKEQLNKLESLIEKLKESILGEKEKQANKPPKEMRPPGFEPGLEAREAPVLPLDYDRFLYLYPMSGT